MVKEYNLLKIINLIYTLIQFAFLYVGFLLMEGSLYKNSITYFFGVIIFVFIILLNLLINFIFSYKIYKKDGFIIYKYLLWILVPILSAIISFISVVF